MKKSLFILAAAIGVCFFEYADDLSNGGRPLALQQFESAKKAFNQQDYFLAERLAQNARVNAPDTAGPWLLIGNCYYLQGQDQAALYHYNQAIRLDPTMGHLPRFLDFLRRDGNAGVEVSLTPETLADLHRKIGQMIMVSVPGTSLSPQKRIMLNSGWIGGVVLFNQNILSKEQVALYIRQIQGNSPTPLFVAVDQEGGSVRRFRENLGFQRLPSLEAVGQLNDPDIAYRFGFLSGRQLREVGANLNLAPVVDLDHGIEGSIISKYHRSLGSNPELVSSLAGQIILGMRSQRIIATAKHFPTQSIVTENTHEKVVYTDISLQRLETEDFVPYRELIEKNLLDAVMLSHVVYKDIDPYFPASLSPEMIQVFLRRKLGFEGLVISDDLRMGAIKNRYPLEISAVQAVKAGVDVLLVTDNFERRVMDALVKAVVGGKIPMKTIDLAYERILKIKTKYGIITPDTKKAQVAVTRAFPIRSFPSKPPLAVLKTVPALF